MIQVLKSNILLIAGLMFVTFSMSFSNNSEKPVAADTIYTYNSTSKMEGDFANTSNWIVVSTTPSCLTTGTRPCNIVVPSGSTLSSIIGGLTNDQVLAIHNNERKP